MIDLLQLGASIGGAFIIGWFLYVNAFVKHRNEKTENYLIEKWSVFGEDAHVDELTKAKYEKSKNWYHGYTAALLALIAGASVVGWFAPSLIAEKWSIPEGLEPLVSFIAAFLSGIVIDYFVVHPIAEGVFFSKVEEPILRTFLEAPDKVDGKEPADESEVAEAAPDAPAKDPRETPDLNAELMKAAEAIIEYLKH